LLQAVKSFFTCYGGQFQWNLFGAFGNEYNALPVVAATISLFMFCYQVNFRTNIIKRLMYYVAAASLEIYLLTVTNLGSQIPYVLVDKMRNTPTIIIFALALVLSMIFNTLFGYLLHKLNVFCGNRVIKILQSRVPGRQIK
jgi:hypothetical protein